MKYLLDSDAIIGYLKSIPKWSNLLNDIDDSEKGTSIINISEVLEGFPKEKYYTFKEFTETMTVFTIDWKVAEVFAETRAKMRKDGNLIDNMDLLIASTCLANNLTLITGNVKHFERIKGLKIKTVNG